MPGYDRHEPLIVVGTGIAGSLLALGAAPSGPVVVVTKDVVGEGSTKRAQGGIAAAVDLMDSWRAHLDDTLYAGAGLCDLEAAARICREGPAQVAALLGYGVPFDRRDGRLELGREGAHSVARVVHAGGDATGAHIVEALSAALRADPRIELAENERALEVVVCDGCVTGLRTIDAAGRERIRPARAVALAAGGTGHLYPRTTNPLGATADGPALAARAGAALADLEMVQFHPTALAVGDSPLPLVSEAVRGEGAHLRDARGRRFMLDAHPMAELGPRDVVARAIARRAAEDGVDVTLDLRHIDPAEVRERFPTVAALCAEHGLDLAADPIPVTPAAHSAIGGALADMEGRTTVPGLFAVGECAATGAHGANRLASNGLLEAAVLASGAARLLAGDPLAGWPEHPAPCSPVAPPEPGGDGAAVRRALQAEMWAGVGVERDGDALRAAGRALAALPEGTDPETDNLLLVARLACAAAELRTESRGGHYRRDHPLPDPGQARRIAWVGGAPIHLPLRDARSGRTLAKEAA
ncbi:MAG: L-aspartate oxidase [Thermoleophilia bacterium]